MVAREVDSFVFLLSSVRKTKEERKDLSHTELTLRASCLISLCNGGAFVVCLLAFGERDLDLGASVFEVDARRHDRHAFDADVVPQFADLFFVEQEFSLALRVVVESVGLLVRRDVRLDQPGLFAVLDVHVGFLDADLPRADGLDLTSLQHQTRLEFFEQEIFETRLAIVGNSLHVFSHDFMLPHSSFAPFLHDARVFGYDCAMFDLRKHFLLDPSVVFLNHGSFGATPKPVFLEYQRWQKELENQPVEFLGRRITSLMAESRSILGSYLGTPADNLIYAQNATIALNIVARSLDLKTDDEVLATAHEYGAVDRMWRFLARENGFKYVNQITSTPIRSKEEFIEEFWAGVTPKTRVVCISHISSPTAIIFPVEEIIRRAREAGIVTIVDGAHAPGQLPLQLDSLGADFYAGNLHKWLCVPKGAGFLYARPEAQKLVKPLVVSWGYESETPSGSTFVDHHEWWGTRDMAAFLSVPAAIEFQEKHDWERVREACHQLAVDTQKRLCDLTGLSPLHPPGGDWIRQMFTAPLPADTDVALLKNRLYDEFRIEVPVHEWNGNKLIRVSVQGYNTQEDVDALCGALSRLL